MRGVPGEKYKSPLVPPGKLHSSLGCGSCAGPFPTQGSNSPRANCPSCLLVAPSCSPPARPSCLREAAEAVPARQEVPAPAAPSRRSHRSIPGSCSEDNCWAALRSGSCCPSPCKWQTVAFLHAGHRNHLCYRCHLGYRKCRLASPLGAHPRALSLLAPRAWSLLRK